MFDPNKIQSQRRSSMKGKTTFPEGMTLEQFVALQEKKKSMNLKWDTKVTDLEGNIETLKTDSNSKDKEKYTDAKTHFIDFVN